MTIKYLDAKRIRGSSTQAKTTTVDEDFSSVGSWVQVGSPVSINTGNSRVQNSGYSNVAPNYYVYKDLGASFNPFDQSFVLRYKTLLGTASSQAGYWGVGWTDSTSDANSGDHWTQAICTSGSGGYIRFQDSINGSYSEVANSSTSPAPSGLASVCYVHVVFDSSTNVIRYRAYSNSDFSTGELVDLSYTLTPSNYQGMRYLFVGSVNASGRYLTGSYTTDLKLYLNTTDITPVDEKATLLNTKSTTTTNDWTAMDTAYINWYGGKLHIDSKADGTRDNLYYTHSGNFSTTWVLRWKQYWTTQTEASGGDRTLKIGIASAGDESGNNDASNQVTSMHNLNSSKNQWQLQGKGATQAVNNLTGDFASDKTWYCELIKTSASAATFTIRDTSYTNSTIKNNQAITGMSGIADQDTIFIANRDTTLTSTSADISYVTDMEFYDNMTTASGTPTLSFDFVNKTQENTLFEETDTQRTYFLQDNTGISKAGCLGFWTFQEQSGDVINQATTANGFADGLGSAADGVLDSGLKRDAVGNFRTYAYEWLDGSVLSVDVPNQTGLSSGLQGDITITMWIYPTANYDSNGRIFIAKRDATSTTTYQIYWGVSNEITYYTGNSYSSTMNSNAPLTLNAWNFLATTIASNELTIYLNGYTLNISGSSSDTTHTVASRSTNSAPLTFGQSSLNNTEDYAGRIQDSTIWNRALSEAEITAMYNSGRGVFDMVSGVGWYR